MWLLKKMKVFEKLSGFQRRKTGGLLSRRGEPHFNMVISNEIMSLVIINVASSILIR